MARRPAGADLLALGAVLALLSAIAFAFGGGPAHASDEPMDAPLTVLAVDVSPSMLNPRPGIRRWLLRKVEAEAREARAAGHELALVTYAARVVRRFDPGSADDFFAALREGGSEWFGGGAAASLDGEAEEPGTDLSGALLVALNLHRKGLRARGQTVVIGDGTFTRKDPSDLLVEPRLGQVKWIEPEPGTKPDLEVVRVRAPLAVEPGVPVRCLVDLRLVHGKSLPKSTHVRFEWTLRASSVAALERGRNRLKWSEGYGVEPVPAPALWSARNMAGSRPSQAGGRSQRAGTVPSFSLPLVLPAMKEGSGELLVTASLVRGPKAKGGQPGAALAEPLPDAFPGTNHGRAEWAVGDPTRVLVLAPSQSDAADQIAALFVGPAYDGIEFLTGDAAGMEDQLRGARRPHVILTSGLPLAALQGPALKSFVMGGGGWFHSEGWSSLRDDGGVLSPLLALRPDVEPRQPRDIVFVVDGSGSMEGARWQRAKYALAQLLPSISPDDRLKVRFFTQVLGKAHIEFEAAPVSASEEERAQRRQEVMSQLRDLKIPGGSTDITGSLSMLMREREEEVAAGNSRSSLVIVISDGRSTVSGTAPKPIRSTLMELGDEVVAIQVGDEGAFRGSLSKLAGGVENVVQAGELRGVLGILQEAVQGAKPIEEAQMLSVPPGATEFAEMIAEATRQAQLETPLVIQQALPCRASSGATPIFDVLATPKAPTDGESKSEAVVEGEEIRRGVFAAVAARGLGMTVGIALPMLDPDGERWAPEFERRPQWMAPIFREMRQRFEQAESQRNGAPVRGSVAIEGEGSEAHLVVRGLPADAPAEVAGELRLVGAVGEFSARAAEAPLPSSVVAELNLVPSAFGAGGLSSRVAPRPPVLDLYPRGTLFELELAGDSLMEPGASGAPLALSLAGDGSTESDVSAEPPAILMLLEQRRGSGPPAGFTGPGETGEAPPPPTGSPAPAHGARAGHPIAPWLALGSLLALFLGALGGQVPWRRRGVGALG